MKNIHDVPQDLLSLSSKGTKNRDKKKKSEKKEPSCVIQIMSLVWPMSHDQGGPLNNPLTRSVRHWFRLEHERVLWVVLQECFPIKMLFAHFMVSNLFV
jgi:hypothetical protein